MQPEILAPTPDERIETFLSWKDHAPHFHSRGKVLNPKENVCIVKTHYDTEAYEITKDWIYGFNVVTNDGDTYYARSAVGETPLTNQDFDSAAEGRLVLRNMAVVPAKTDTYTQLDTGGGALDAAATDYQALNATYPLTNDADGDNTGAGVDIATWLYDWLTTELNATGIVGGGIVDRQSMDPPPAGAFLLNHFTVTSFDKTAADTLKVFVNHEMAGQLP